jgi:DNA replication protein DnaC
MEIVEDRHGRSSTLIASQLPVKAWHDLIGDPTFADAILDRLVHNAYRLELEGPRSMRETDPDGEVHAASTATPNGKSAKGARK